MNSYIIVSNIITMDNERPFAGAVVILGEKIAWAGEKEEIPAEYENLPKLDLSGKTVVPGFIDTHVHVVASGMVSGGCDLTGVHSMEETLSRLREAEQKMVGEGWLFAGHFQDKLIAEKRMPTRYELDTVSKERPIFIYHNDCHPFSFNSAAIELLGLEVSTPGVCSDDGVSPNGVVVDPACADVDKSFFEKLSDSEYEKAYRETEDRAVKNGITTIFAKEYLRTIKALVPKRDSFKTSLKPMMRTANGCADQSDLKELIEAEKLRAETTVCTFLDGAFDGWSAANFEPYEGQPENYGMLYNTDEELYSYFHLAYENNMQVSAHSIGDRALEQYLRVMARLQKEFPETSRRPRIEHFEMPTPSQIGRTAKMNIALGMQPLLIEVCEGMDFSGYYPYVGRRVVRCSPYKSILDAGCLVGGGSDHPVTEMNPLHAISIAMKNPVEKERISVIEGLKMFTTDAAKLGFLENSKGCIRAGMDADFAVLSGDPLAQEPDSITVEATISRGRKVYEREI